MNRHLAYLNWIIAFAFIGCFSQCTGRSEKSNLSDFKARLELVDSVQFDVLASGLNLMDIHAGTGHMLLIQTSPPVVYIFDQKGQLIQSNKLPIQGPGAVGNDIASAEFFEDGVALMGRNVINIYDSELTFLKTLKFPFPASGMMYLGFNHLQEATIDGINYLTAFNGVQNDFPANQPGYYQHFNVLDHVNLETEEFKPIGKLQPESRFLDGKVHYFLKPTFHTVGNLLYYALDNDTVLYTMDLKTEEIINKIKIPFDNFVVSQGLTMGQAGIDEQLKPTDWAGKISNFFHVDSLDIFLYNPGIKLSKIEEMKILYSKESVGEKYDSLNAKRYLILKDGKSLNNNMKLPTKMIDVVQASADGYLWASQKVSALKEEPDKVTFYKLQVVVE